MSPTLSLTSSAPAWPVAFATRYTPSRHIRRWGRLPARKSTPSRFSWSDMSPTFVSGCRARTPSNRSATTPRDGEPGLRFGRFLVAPTGNRRQRLHCQARAPSSTSSRFAGTSAAGAAPAAAARSVSANSWSPCCTKSTENGRYESVGCETKE
jgi:hypothetical protein